jgi:hypothetical protein
MFGPPANQFLIAIALATLAMMALAAITEIG